MTGLDGLHFIVIVNCFDSVLRLFVKHIVLVVDENELLHCNPLIYQCKSLLLFDLSYNPRSVSKSTVYKLAYMVILCSFIVISQFLITAMMRVTNLYSKNIIEKKNK